MILREWRAEIRRELADEYVAYVQKTGIAAYRAQSGNMWAGVAIRDIDEHRSEIVTISAWTSMEAITAFAGPEPERARYFPEDDRFLLTRPSTVKHYRYFAGDSDAER